VGTEVVGVEQWAEVRRLFFVRGWSQREIHRRTGLHRDTIRNAINSEVPPKYERAPAGSKLDPFKDEIHRLLREDPKLPGQRVRELICEQGFDVFCNELDFQDQLDAWFGRVNSRTHKTLRERPVDRLAREVELMARLHAAPPDVDRRWVTRVPPDPACALTPTTTRLTPAWSAGASRSASRRASCWRSRWTRANSLVAISAASPSIGR
jgi:hypothetical protein